MTEALAIMDTKRKYIAKRLQAIPQLEFAYRRTASIYHVTLVPGSAFGVKNGLRFSSMETIEHALDGLEQSLGALSFIPVAPKLATRSRRALVDVASVIDSGIQAQK
ncbi:hypothetical protein V7S43_006212 [Phytophthora oleae]|uniref:Uncharacterized protein n=1 Tax=Phytophthora oleae TaxID=2107226 RepID=A0ABD3FRJ2_9STRA